MADYQLCAAGVVRIADDVVIPDDTGNADWQRYQAWLAAGNTPDAAPTPPPPPAPLTTPQKLAAIGITVADLKTALGIS